MKGFNWRLPRIGKRASIENPATPLSKALPAYVGGKLTDAGLSITPENSLAISTVYQCVDLVSGDVGKLPLDVFGRLDGGGKQKDKSHPASYLLRRKPCPEITASVFKQTLTQHAMLRGNGYGYIYRDEHAVPYEILPLGPGRTFPIRLNGVLLYITQVDGQWRKLRAEDVIHIRGMGDAYSGYSVVEYAAQSFGLAAAAEKFGAAFFSRGSVSSGVLETPKGMSDEEIEHLRKSIDSMHQGLDKAFRLMLLEEGTKFTSISIPPEQAQFLGTREFQKRDVAGWFKVPPSKVGDVQSRTWASLEQDAQSYLDSAVDPWLIQWEEQCWDKLLTEKEKRDDTHVVEFNRNALMKIQASQRAVFYRSGLDGGWLNVDEVRDRENLNPLPNGEGKKFRIPLNMAQTGGPQKKEPESPNEDERQQPLLESHRALVVDALERVVRRVGQQARKAATGPNNCSEPKKFCGWLDQFDELRTWAGQQFAPAMRAATVATGREVPDLAAALVESLHQRLNALAAESKADELLASVESYMAEREQNAPNEFANRVITKATNYAAAA